MQSGELVKTLMLQWVHQEQLWVWYRLRAKQPGIEPATFPNWTINQAKKILKSQTRAQVSVNAVKHTENRSTGLKVSKSTDQRSSYCSWGTGSLFGASCGHWRNCSLWSFMFRAHASMLLLTAHRSRLLLFTVHLVWNQHLLYDSVCFQSFGRTWETGQRFSLKVFLCSASGFFGHLGLEKQSSERWKKKQSRHLNHVHMSSQTERRTDEPPRVQGGWNELWLTAGFFHPDHSSHHALFTHWCMNTHHTITGTTKICLNIKSYNLSLYTCKNS